jgi:hypothetical protein
MQEAYDKAYALATDGKYSFGAWTPTRCLFWELLETDELKQRFFNWVEKEKEQRKFHDFELPKPPST